MAKARMLHKIISVSEQVNRLSLPARLLYTWIIAHADDEGRLKGNPEYIKATVVPMTNYSFKKIGAYIEEIKVQELIYYWEVNNEWFIEFVKWKEFQKIRKSRFTPSLLPSFPVKKDNQKMTIGQPDGNLQTPQANIGEYSSKESNKSEDNKEIADKNLLEKDKDFINPHDFRPSSGGEAAALEAWRKLEPNNPKALITTYLSAVKKGVLAQDVFRFVSEIKQDKTIKNPGAVFNKKVEMYLKRRLT